jgi:subfamily B ATP-binding cassette protein MsbA
MKNLLRLLSWLRPYRREVVLSVLLSFGVAALNSLSLSSLLPILNTLFAKGGLASVQAGATKWIGAVSPGAAALVVRVFLPGPLVALAAMLAAVVLMAVLKGVLRFLDDYLVGRVAIAASRDLSNELFTSLLKQPVLFIEREGVGTVASRFTADADEVVRGLKTLTGTLFREPLQFLFLLALALLVSPFLTAVSLVLFPAIALLIRATGRVAKHNARKVLAHRSRLLSLIQEAFFSVRVVQTFRAEAAEVGRFTEENQRLYEENRRLVRIEALTSPAMEMIVVLGVAGALFLGGTMAVRGDLTVGALVLFYGAIGAMYEPIRKLGSAVPRVQAGLAGARRIFDYLDRVPEIREAPHARPLPPLADCIRIEGVSFRYEGRAEALAGIDLTIRAGEQIAIVGPSGSGKSTLAGLLPRFFDPTAGTVRIDGRDIRDATLASLRGQIAVVFQETVLLDASIRENVALARPDAPEAEIREAARLAHVTEFADRLPEGFETRVGERGVALSGGQRQRIAIARALLARPRILILDEAVSNVDEESARLIRQSLEETREGRTTIVVTHRLDTLDASDRVAVLARGRLEAVGRPEEILAASSTWQSLLARAPDGGAG